MRRLLGSLGSFALLFTASSATAKEAPPPAPPARQVVTFGDALVGGGVDRPFVELILRTPRPGFSPMVKVRADFLPELQRSADQL